MMSFSDKILASLALCCMLFVLLACNGDENDPKTSAIDKKQQKEQVEEANRNLVKLERETIDEYVKHSGKCFVETGTGLRYFIENQGNGELIKKGYVVMMEYELRLLNGDLIYSSNKDGIKTFLVGRGGVESGLEEAVLNLHIGDEATVVIPSHLAHGLIGDGKGIPPRSTIVYRIKIIDNQLNN